MSSRRVIPRKWRFPIDRDDYRDSFNLYHKHKKRYYICDVTIVTGEVMTGVYFSEQLIAAETNKKGGIPERLYGVGIARIRVVESHGCSSNEITKLLTHRDQDITFG